MDLEAEFLAIQAKEQKWRSRVAKVKSRKRHDNQLRATRFVQRNKKQTARLERASMRRKQEQEQRRRMHLLQQWKAKEKVKASDLEARRKRMEFREDIERRILRADTKKYQSLEERRRAEQKRDQERQEAALRAAEAEAKREEQARRAVARKEASLAKAKRRIDEDRREVRLYQQAREIRRVKAYIEATDQRQREQVDRLSNVRESEQRIQSAYRKKEERLRQQEARLATLDARKRAKAEQTAVEAEARERAAREKLVQRDMQVLSKVLRKKALQEMVKNSRTVFGASLSAPGSGAIASPTHNVAIPVTEAVLVESSDQEYADEDEAMGSPASSRTSGAGRRRRRRSPADHDTAGVTTLSEAVSPSLTRTRRDSAQLGPPGSSVTGNEIKSPTRTPRGSQASGAPRTSRHAVPMAQAVKAAAVARAQAAERLAATMGLAADMELLKELKKHQDAGTALPAASRRAVHSTATTPSPSPRLTPRTTPPPSHISPLSDVRTTQKVSSTKGTLSRAPRFGGSPRMAMSPVLRRNRNKKLGSKVRVPITKKTRAAQKQNTTHDSGGVSGGTGMGGSGSVSGGGGSGGLLDQSPSKYDITGDSSTPPPPSPGNSPSQEHSPTQDHPQTPSSGPSSSPGDSVAGTSDPDEQVFAAHRNAAQRFQELEAARQRYELRLQAALARKKVEQDTIRREQEIRDLEGQALRVARVKQRFTQYKDQVLEEDSRSVRKLKSGVSLMNARLKHDLKAIKAHGEAEKQQRTKILQQQLDREAAIHGIARRALQPRDPTESAASAVDESVGDGASATPAYDVGDGRRAELPSVPERSPEAKEDAVSSPAHTDVNVLDRSISRASGDDSGDLSGLDDENNGTQTQAPLAGSPMEELEAAESIFNTFDADVGDGVGKEGEPHGTADTADTAAPVPLQPLDATSAVDGDGGGVEGSETPPAATGVGDSGAVVEVDERVDSHVSAQDNELPTVDSDLNNGAITHRVEDNVGGDVHQRTAENVSSDLDEGTAPDGPVNASADGTDELPTTSQPTPADNDRQTQPDTHAHTDDTSVTDVFAGMEGLSKEEMATLSAFGLDLDGVTAAPTPVNNGQQPPAQTTGETADTAAAVEGSESANGHGGGNSNDSDEEPPRPPPEDDGTTGQVDAGDDSDPPPPPPEDENDTQTVTETTVPSHGEDAMSTEPTPSPSQSSFTRRMGADIDYDDSEEGSGADGPVGSSALPPTSSTEDASHHTAPSPQEDSKTNHEAKSEPAEQVSQTGPSAPNDTVGDNDDGETDIIGTDAGGEPNGIEDGDLGGFSDQEGEVEYDEELISMLPAHLRVRVADERKAGRDQDGVYVAIASLCAGIDVTKVPAGSFAKERAVQIFLGCYPPEHQALRQRNREPVWYLEWTSTKKKDSDKRILLVPKSYDGAPRRWQAHVAHDNGIARVVCGQHEGAFKSSKWRRKYADLAAVSFSLIGRSRSLDVVCQELEDYSYAIVALQAFLESTN